MLLALGLGHVGIIFADLDGGAGRLASEGLGRLIVNRVLRDNHIDDLEGTHSCLTPTVQHCAGGLEAILMMCGGRGRWDMEGVRKL